MSETIQLSAKDLLQIKSIGLSREAIGAQVATIRQGIAKTNLDRPCRLDDGVEAIAVSDHAQLIRLYENQALQGRAMKFVPASGAATRMFEDLRGVLYAGEAEGSAGRAPDESEQQQKFKKGCKTFINNLHRFAFTDMLKATIEAQGLAWEDVARPGNERRLLQFVLTSVGLDLENTPKALVPFHIYDDNPRTALEEHMVEAAMLVTDRQSQVSMHFVAPQQHLSQMEKAARRFGNLYGRGRYLYDISFSVQENSTNCIALESDGSLFRKEDGSLLLRPGGHGALLENLARIEADIVFIKNIDNIVPDRLKGPSILHKKIMAGKLVEIQTQIFGFIEDFEKPGHADDKTIRRALEWKRWQLSIADPVGLDYSDVKAVRSHLMQVFNRPLRICGMVKRVDRPGGAPYWVNHEDGKVSIQIVETSQIDLADCRQKEIFESSTHFNPTDIVCGMRDRHGRPYPLMKYRDPKAAFMVTKSVNGRILRSMEHPGLWNGSMADWNTVFVEVPLITFNPVKMVNDILEPNHQPQ